MKPPKKRNLKPIAMGGTVPQIRSFKPGFGFMNPFPQSGNPGSQIGANGGK